MWGKCKHNRGSEKMILHHLIHRIDEWLKNKGRKNLTESEKYKYLKIYMIVN